MNPSEPELFWRDRHEIARQFARNRRRRRERGRAGKAQPARMGMQSPSRRAARTTVGASEVTARATPRKAKAAAAVARVHEVGRLIGEEHRGSRTRRQCGRSIRRKRPIRTLP